MDDRVEDFTQKAKRARLSASKTQDEVVKSQWLVIAEMWELLALEFQNISRTGKELR